MKTLILFLSFILYPFAFVWADCLLLPIIGNGSDASPYRPAIPPGIEGVAGANWSAHIPSNPNGSPQYPDTYVCFPSAFKLPPGIASKAIPPADAAAAILIRDPNASIKAMTPPPAVIKGSMRDYLDRAYRFAARQLGAALAWAASATDTFTGTGALSANWSVGYGSEGTPTRVSDAAECAIGVRCVASYNALTASGDMYAQGIIAQYTTPGSVDDGDAGPSVQMGAPTSFDGYFARCGNSSSGSVSTIIQKRLAGASSTIGTEPASGAWAFGDTSRIEIIGTGIVVYRNGTPVASGTATPTYLTGRRGGMMINSAFASGSGDTSRLDNFEVGDLSGASARRRVVVVQ